MINGGSSFSFRISEVEEEEEVIVILNCHFNIKKNHLEIFFQN
jgi:hypothetical protein